MGYRLGNVFYGTYPREAAIWCNEGGQYHIDEVESDTNERKFKIVRTEISDQQTPEEIKEMLTEAIQQSLDRFAQEKNYDNIMSVCSYYGSTVERFAKEAAFCMKLRDDTWIMSYQILDDVIAGNRPIPTIEELLAELPIGSANWDNIQ